MFGLPSPSKLLVLIAVVAIVWYGFKLVGRLDAARKSVAKGDDDSRGGVDTVSCAVCGAYVAADGATSCGRADCPYPGGGGA